VFADLGNDVVCVDNNLAKIDALKAGRMPIYEPGLEEMVARNAVDRRLTFTTDLGAGIRHGDVIFIAVGTPPKDTGETDLSHVEAVAAEIGRSMDRYKVVVNKSTVPVGTGELVREVIGRHQPRPIEFDDRSAKGLIRLLLRAHRR
jgi:UDPglucose 6-dehydrogenase